MLAIVRLCWYFVQVALLLIETKEGGQNIIMLYDFHTELVWSIASDFIHLFLVMIRGFFYTKF